MRLCYAIVMVKFLLNRKHGYAMDMQIVNVVKMKVSVQFIVKLDNFHVQYIKIPQMHEFVFIKNIFVTAKWIV